jgi:flagellar motor protein MotB
MSGEDESTGSSGASFTDLMTSLAVIFVLLTVALFNRRTGEKETERTALIAALKGPLQQAGLPDSSIRDDTTSVVIILPDSALFDRGSDLLRPAGEALVRRLMPVVADTLCSGRFQPKLETVIVEGHTDRTIPWGMSPDQGRLHNLALSQRRSMNFVGVTTQGVLEAPMSDSLRRGVVFDCIIRLTSATGRGQEQHLLSASDTSQAQRRVLLRIRFKSARPDSMAMPLRAGASQESR